LFIPKIIDNGLHSLELLMSITGVRFF